LVHELQQSDGSLAEQAVSPAVAGIGFSDEGKTGEFVREEARHTLQERSSRFNPDAHSIHSRFSKTGAVDEFFQRMSGNRRKNVARSFFLGG